MIALRTSDSLRVRERRGVFPASRPCLKTHRAAVGRKCPVCFVVAPQRLVRLSRFVATPRIQGISDPPAIPVSFQTGPGELAMQKDCSWATVRRCDPEPDSRKFIEAHVGRSSVKRGSVKRAAVWEKLEPAGQQSRRAIGNSGAAHAPLTRSEPAFLRRGDQGSSAPTWVSPLAIELALFGKVITKLTDGAQGVRAQWRPQHG